MPLTRRSLTLPPNPAAVRIARSWVGDILAEVGRDDLVFGAELGVSELVTNAILHARPPITVRVRGTQEHPRVEVSDHSTRALRLLQLSADGDAVTTFGRGLALVALHSAHWGWDRTADGIGKTVWFEPMADMHDDVDLAAGCEGPIEPEAAPETPIPAGSVSITLRNMPAALFGTLRRYHFELRRELRLLALSDPERYPLAVQATEVFLRADVERQHTQGIDKLDHAIARNLESVDLEYEAPITAPATMEEALVLFAEVRRALGGEQLLAVTPDQQLLALQQWYFGEFVRQGRGEEPRPWERPTGLRAESAS